MDRDKVWAFLERFTGFASGFTTIGLLALADRTGLLAVMAGGAPMPAAEAAERSGVDRRYAEEILSGLAAAEVVDYDPGTGAFRLQPEHAAVIADDASPYSMGGWLDLLPALVERLPDLVSVAETGDGVAHSAYDDRVVAGIDRANSPGIRILLTRRWLPTMPDVVDRLERGGRVVDIGCGSGTAAVTMATAYPDTEVLGVDIDELSIERARSRSSDVPNITFVTGDASELPADPPFDLVTAFDVVHDLPQPRATLLAVRGALAPGGVFLMMEPNVADDLEDNLNSRAALLYGVSTMFCMTQSLAQGGAGLGAAWGPSQAKELCREAGFGSFQRLPIDNPFSAFYRVEA
ncbi:class I SAM-dependent methyltransferase [soil metagenome]